jgi:hypothetical protein
MSNLKGNANHSRRTRMSAVIFIIGLAIFATIATVESNSLQWPLASEVQNIASYVRPPSTSNSSIFVSAKSILPNTNNAVCINIGGNNSCSYSSIEQPIVHAQLTVYTFSPRGLLGVASGFTNGSGEQAFILSPNDYEIKMISQVGNTTNIITTHNGNTTELNIFINETSYRSSFVDISQSISPSIIAPWDDIFMTVPSSSLLMRPGSNNESLYLEFVSPSCASLQQQTTNCPVTSQKYSANLINEYSSVPSGTVWLQVKLNNVANISTNSSVYVLTYVSYYTVKEFHMNTTLSGT